MLKFSSYNILREEECGFSLYNSFTKASIYLDKSFYSDSLNNLEIFKREYSDLISLFRDYGFIIDADRDELAELEYLFNLSYFDKSVLNIVLVPSLACNFKCPYCFEKGHTYSYNVDEYFNILKIYAKKHFKNYRKVQLSLFGGEPLLYIDKIFEFLDFVSDDAKSNSYQYCVSMVTNGSLLTTEILHKLMKHNLFSLQITLDSDKDKHNQLRIFKDGSPSFDLLLDKINTVVAPTLLETSYQFNIRINLTNTNPELFEETLQYIIPAYRPYITLLIRAVYDTPSYNESNCNSIKHLKEYYDVGSKLGFKIVKSTYYHQSCEGCADSRFFYLMPDLSMWKCINNLDYDGACIGKIKADGEPIVNATHVSNWYACACACFKDADCIQCNLLPDCLGGCILYCSKNKKKMCKTYDMASLPYRY